MNNKKSDPIKIKFKKIFYEGSYRYVHQYSGRLVLQIAYPIELCKILKQEFIQTFFAIESQKLLLENKKFKTNLLGGNQEIVIFRVINDACIEFIPYVKIATPFDNVFKRMVELNVFGWMSREMVSKCFITKYSGWQDISELPKHADTSFVVYYLVDEINRKLYIGSAKRLGDRVKPNRHEIPFWNKFMYEVVHPDFHGLLQEIEYHSIMAFSKFLTTNRGRSDIEFSEYQLVNRDYKYYRN